MAASNRSKIPIDAVPVLKKIAPISIDALSLRLRVDEHADNRFGRRKKSANSSGLNAIGAFPARLTTDEKSFASVIFPQRSFLLATDSATEFPFQASHRNAWTWEEGTPGRGGCRDDGANRRNRVCALEIFLQMGSDFRGDNSCRLWRTDTKSDVSVAASKECHQFATLSATDWRPVAAENVPNSQPLKHGGRGGSIGR
jgi:hypothetical protein